MPFGRETPDNHVPGQATVPDGPVAQKKRAELAADEAAAQTPPQDETLFDDDGRRGD